MTDWNNHELDAQLQTALDGLALSDGLPGRVQAALPAEGPQRAEGAARALMLAALAGAAAVLLVFGLTWESMVAAESWVLATWTAASLGSVAVGLALALGARGLSELDSRIVERVTGHSAAICTTDIVLVRAGALFILLLPLTWGVLSVEF